MLKPLYAPKNKKKKQKSGENNKIALLLHDEKKVSLSRKLYAKVH